MVRRQSETSKVSLYRLTRPKDGSLESCVQDKYYERGFEVRPLSIETREALLVFGSLLNERPGWIDHVRSLTDIELGLHNDTAAGLLLVSHDSFIYALSWGMGHLIIDPARLDSSFGLRFAVRRADPDEVRSVTTHAMDTLPRTARTSVPGGARLDAFGMEEIGEIVSRLVGRISASGFSAEKPNQEVEITVRGADALSLPLGKTPQNMLRDIDLIDRVVELESPAPGLEHLENTQPLRPQNPLIPALSEMFAASLGGESSKLALCWPAEWEEDQGEASYYALSGMGPEWNGIVDELQLSDLLEPVYDLPQESRIKKLKNLKVQALDGGRVPMSRQIGADRWLIFEVDHEGQKYLYRAGKWYNVGGAYLEMLSSKVERILQKRLEYSLPGWPLEYKKRKKTNEIYTGLAKEGTFNEYVADLGSDFVCMDRKLIRTKQHPRGFEACDLLGPGNELIHVKKLDDSVSASHLFNQAIVSTEALRRQADAVSLFRDEVREASNGRRVLPDDFRPSVVVLAFGGRAVSPEHLFTFSQVSLGRCADRLGELDVLLKATDIKTSAKILGDSTS